MGACEFHFFFVWNTVLITIISYFSWYRFITQQLFRLFLCVNWPNRKLLFFSPFNRTYWMIYCFIDIYVYETFPRWKLINDYLFFVCSLKTFRGKTINEVNTKIWAYYPKAVHCHGKKRKSYQSMCVNMV